MADNAVQKELNSIEIAFIKDTVQSYINSQLIGVLIGEYAFRNKGDSKEWLDEVKQCFLIEEEMIENDSFPRAC